VSKYHDDKFREAKAALDAGDAKKSMDIALHAVMESDGTFNEGLQALADAGKRHTDEQKRKGH